jgi:3'-5' exoribonuclease
MKLMKKDIKPNERITTYFALQSIELRKSRKTQQNYLVLGLFDRTGEIKGYLWDDPVVTAATLKEKSFVKVRGTTKSINGSLIINVEKIRQAEETEIDSMDYLEVVPGGRDLWQKRLFDAIELIRDQNCRRLISAFLEDDHFLENFTAAPGGKSVHHNYIGGLLEHTVNTMELASFIAEKHGGLVDGDLLLTGAFLHDIGKTRELSWFFGREYTTEGKLLGHIGLGVLMLEQRVSKLHEFPENLSLLIKHMILSHHGTLEYGSPVRPATTEALLLHLIENTDAKLNHLYCHLSMTSPLEEWTSYDRFLETEIYRGKFSRKPLREPEEKAA